MTQDELIEMAKQAGWNDDLLGVSFVLPMLETFAKLVAAHEREACAKLADEYATWGGSNFYDWFKKLAAAIRARGQQ